MTVRETWELQNQLAHEQRKLDSIGELLAQADRQAAYGGAFVGTTDYLTHPEYRAQGRVVEALQGRVSAAQEAAGGVVYRIAEAKLEALVKRLDTLKKRVAKNGLAGVLSYRVTEERDEVEITASSLPGYDAATSMENWLKPRVIAIHRYTFVTLAADRLKLADWALLAKLSVEEAGVMVAKVPAISRAWTMFKEGLSTEAPSYGEKTAAELAAAEHLDTTNLARFANLETAGRCDHCGLARRRTATYVVENLKSGELKQVGSNCLADFIGVDPKHIISFFTYLDELANDLGEDGEESYGRGSRPEVPTFDYLTHVCTMLRVNGWAAKSGYGTPTASQAADNRYFLNNQKRDRQTGQPLWVEQTEADFQRAEAAIDWADSFLREKVNAAHTDNRTGDASDFERNLYVAAMNSIVTDRTQGTLAYLPVAHARHLEREIEFQNREKLTAESSHVGEVGKRVELTLTVLAVFEHEGNYGTSFITQMVDGAGNKFKWFGSYELERGTTYTGKWTIKDHGEWKGVKETQVNRPANLAPVNDKQEVLA